MRRLIFIFLLLFTFSAFLYATPDRERAIIDVLIGYMNDSAYILQYVYDNNQSHDDHINELYLNIKYILNEELVLKEQIRLSNSHELIEYMSNPDFLFAIPSIVPNEYMLVSKSKSNTIEYFSIDYSIETLLPKELRTFTLDKIESIYYWNEYMLVAVNLIDKFHIESFRKIILLKEPGGA